LSDKQSQRSLEASRALLISQQVSKGFEDLGNKDAIMPRLGGIYGLEGVMNTSEQYHQPVLEALCAFVRDGTIGMIVNDRGPATDIQAALTVIGRRADGSGSVDLAKSNIPGAILRRANLRRADLSDANLSGTNLSGFVIRHP
jgi:Pentapeptide repeats (8 copies)